MALFLLSLAHLYTIVSAAYIDHKSATNIGTYTAQGHEYVSYMFSGTLILESVDWTPDPKASTTIPSATTSRPIITTSPTITAGPPPSITGPELPSVLTCENKAEEQGRVKNGTTSWPYNSYESVSCCDNLHSQWASLSSFYFSAFSWGPDPYTYWSTTSYNTRQFSLEQCEGPFTTLCDGFPRALCSPPTPQPALEVWSTLVSFSSLTSSRPPMTRSFPLPRPNCMVEPSECASLWDVRASTVGAYNKLHGLMDADDPKALPLDPNFQIDQPYCSSSKQDACLQCGFHNETVQILYWPGEADESLLCGGSPLERNTTSFLSSQVMTAKWGSFTLTSPTVYAFYTMMRDELGCGSPHTSVMVPLNPDEVSTMAFSSELGTVGWVSKIDFRHFAYRTVGSMSYPMIPHTAYTGDLKWGLLPDGIKTIYHDYRPGVIFRVEPSVLASIDPAWRYCLNYQFMAFDPHVALTATAAGLALPTLRPRPSDNPVLLPGATQVAPYPMKTPESNIGSSPTFSNIEGSPDPPPNVGLGVSVAKATPVTINATPAPAEQAPEWAQNLGTGAPGATRQAVEAGQPTPNRNPPVGDAGAQQQAVFTVAGQTFTAKGAPAGGFVIGGSTISANGKPVTVNGVAVSAFTGGIVVGAGAETSLHNTGSLFPLHNTNSFSSASSDRGGTATARDDPTASTTSKRKKSSAVSLSLTVRSWPAVWGFWLFWEVILLVR